MSYLKHGIENHTASVYTEKTILTFSKNYGEISTQGGFPNYVNSILKFKEALIKSAKADSERFWLK